jgi:hypothetical protein
MPMAAADAAPRSSTERRLRLLRLVWYTWNPLGSVVTTTANYGLNACLIDGSCPACRRPGFAELPVWTEAKRLCGSGSKRI